MWSFCARARGGGSNYGDYFITVKKRWTFYSLIIVQSNMRIWHYWRFEIWIIWKIAMYWTDFLKFREQSKSRGDQTWHSTWFFTIFCLLFKTESEYRPNAMMSSVAHNDKINLAGQFRSLHIAFSISNHMPKLFFLFGSLM